MRATIYVDPANSELRGEPFVEEQWLAGALTDLEIVRRYRTDGRWTGTKTVRGLKEQIVGRVTAEKLDQPVASPAVFANITLDVFPAELQWQGDVAELRRDARHDLGPVVPQRPDRVMAGR